MQRAFVALLGWAGLCNLTRYSKGAYTAPSGRVTGGKGDAMAEEEQKAAEEEPKGAI